MSKTGYTGEPLGYEVYIESGEAAWLWNRLVELGQSLRPGRLGHPPAGGRLPLYGHELGTAPDGSTIPIFAIPMARFAVSFSDQKGDYISAGIWKSSPTPFSGS